MKTSNARPENTRAASLFSGYRGTDLKAQLQKAAPLAQQVLLRGLGDLDGLPDSESNLTLLGYVCDLTCTGEIASSESELEVYQRQIRGAYVLGIALGLMLRPEALGIGGRP